MKQLLVITAGIVLGLTTAGVVMATRNTAGTYTYPGGTYPVTGGTTITATWANSLFGDVQTALTNSLDRNGNGGMLAPLRVPDGTVAAPTLAFTNETGTGLYRIGASNPGIAVASTKRQEWTSTGSSVTGTLGVTGTVTGPTIRPPSSTTLDVRALGDVSPATILGTSGTLAAGNVISIQNGSTVLAALAYNGDWNMQGHLVTNLFGTPSASTDAANKGYVDARFVVAGNCASNGTMGTQTGTVTATCSKTGTGAYTVGVSGMTSSGIVGATMWGGPGSIGAVPGSGSVGISTYNLVAGAVAQDASFSFVVFKL